MIMTKYWPLWYFSIKKIWWYRLLWFHYHGITISIYCPTLCYDALKFWKTNCRILVRQPDRESQLLQLEHHLHQLLQWCIFSRLWDLPHWLLPLPTPLPQPLLPSTLLMDSPSHLPYVSIWHLCYKLTSSSHLEMKEWSTLFCVFNYNMNE